MRMAEEKVCKLKCNKRLFIGRLGERVISLLLGWLVAAFREKKQFLLSVCHFAVKLLCTQLWVGRWVWPGTARGSFPTSATISPCEL